MPSQYQGMNLHPGEYGITLAIRRDAEGKNWRHRLLISDGSSSEGVIHPQQDWLDWKRAPFTGEGVSYTTHMAPDNEKIVVLQRFRVGRMTNASGLLQLDNTTPGFIIWIQRQ